MFLKFSLENENGNSKVLSVKIVHKIFGYSLYIFTKINVFFGADMYEKTYLNN